VGLSLDAEGTLAETETLLSSYFEFVVTSGGQEVDSVAGRSLVLCHAAN
jgi:hypothetical protein